ncbi:hypothetical protein AMELA_G00056830, partial [Ameiurus melas]
MEMRGSPHLSDKESVPRMCVLTPLHRQTLCLTLPPAFSLGMMSPSSIWALTILPSSHLSVPRTLSILLISPLLAIPCPQDTPHFLPPTALLR